MTFWTGLLLGQIAYIDIFKVVTCSKISRGNTRWTSDAWIIDALSFFEECASEGLADGTGDAWMDWLEWSIKKIFFLFHIHRCIGTAWYIGKPHSWRQKYLGRNEGAWYVDSVEEIPYENRTRTDEDKIKSEKIRQLSFSWSYSTRIIIDSLAAFIKANWVHWWHQFFYLSFIKWPSFLGYTLWTIGFVRLVRSVLEPNDPACE